MWRNVKKKSKNFKPTERKEHREEKIQIKMHLNLLTQSFTNKCFGYIFFKDFITRFMTD